jgi:hypothetical protein
VIKLVQQRFHKPTNPVLRLEPRAEQISLVHLTTPSRPATGGERLAVLIWPAVYAPRKRDVPKQKPARVSVYHALTGEHIRSIQLGEDRPWAMVPLLSPAGGVLLATAHEANGVRIVDPEVGEPFGMFEYLNLLWSPAGV